MSSRNEQNREVLFIYGGCPLFLEDDSNSVGKISMSIKSERPPSFLWMSSINEQNREVLFIYGGCFWRTTTILLEKYQCLSNLKDIFG